MKVKVNELDATTILSKLIAVPFMGRIIVLCKAALAEINGQYLYLSNNHLNMSFVKIWIHLVFATKNREPLLTTEIRYILYKHIMQNCTDKNIFLQAINGYTDHIHCLISLGKDQSVAKISQLIKGESSHWINQNKLIEGQFSWQDDYFAVSISESQANIVVNYIKNQEHHHARKSFDQEVEEFIRIYGWDATKNP